jgi:hypothetical protein
MTELIDPPTVLDMSQQELEDHLLSLRERRNRVAKIARGVHTRSRNVSSGDLAVKLQRYATKLDKQLAKLDALLTTAERLVNEVVGLRIQTGDVTPDELAEEIAA